MRGRNSKEDEDSGSDWDSMSEMEPAPKVEKKLASNQGQQMPAPLKLKSMTFVDPDVRRGQSGENPPYDFKPEVKTPTRIAEEKQVKPGRQKKGKTYDPQGSQQKHVTFSETEKEYDTATINGNAGGQESDSEDPLYSTVKPKSKQSNPSASTQQRRGDSDEDVKGGRGAKTQKKGAKKVLQGLRNPKAQGVDNKAFVGDDEQDSVDMPPGSQAPLGPILKKPAKTNTPTQDPNIGKSLSTVPLRQSHMIDQSGAGGSYESQRFMSSFGYSSLPVKECPPPLVLSVGETILESAGKKPVEITNRALGEIFAFITFPFTCFALFFHHLLRFILLGLIRPLFVDTLILIVEYLLNPFVNGVVRPVLLSLYGASASISETLVVCVRPITTVLQSFRLVEVNYTRKYSVEEI
ncbi:uncharacterized protein LOC125044246 [Penaeus chinensis]|uniref:uncharacterized protein LOC125044246 n=1 Tax=Penaeus chinensis TaxID=139456 RepID=UPI001FB6FA2D|nr:uncharacterized protein LOC125044246 [Penaeus chinensis]